MFVSVDNSISAIDPLQGMTLRKQCRVCIKGSGTMSISAATRLLPTRPMPLDLTAR